MPIDPPDWSIWSRADLAMLYEAIALSLEMSPKTLRIAHDTVGNFDFLNSDEKKAIGTRVTLSESHLGGKLKVAGEIYQGSRILDTKVHLADFASFATEMGWKLSPRFPGREERDEVGILIPSRLDASTKEKVIRPRERTTLLVIIAALAKEAKIDVRETWKSAQRIERLTLGMGARVSPEAISKKLREIPDALERAGKLGADDE